MQRVFLGTVPEKWKDLKDIDTREYIMLIPLTIIILVLGIYPSAMLDLMNTSVNTLVNFITSSTNVTLGGL